METVGDLLRAIADIADQYGLDRPYLVGGAVRDLLRGKSPKDWDITTGNTDSFLLAHAVADHFGTSVRKMKSGAQKVVVGDVELDFSNNVCFPGFEQNLAGETFSRDFTVNCLLMDCRTGELLDLVGGLKDLEAGRLVCPVSPETSFGSDASRMMRALRYFGDGFELNQDIWDYLSSHGERFSEIPHRHAGSMLNHAIREKPELIEKLVELGILGHMPQTELLVEMLIKSRRLQDAF